MQGETYITSSVVFDSNRVYKNGQPVFEIPGADLQGFLLAAYQHSGIKYSRFYKMDNLSKMGWLSTEILLKDSFDKSNYEDDAVGILLTNASASLDADLKYFESARDIASPALFVYTLPNIVMGEICIKHSFKGENAFFIFESFNPDFIENYVANLVNNNILQACICGWVELIGEEYKCALYLVEKFPAGENIPGRPEAAAAIKFSTENLYKIYHLQNG